MSSTIPPGPRSEVVARILGDATTSALVVCPTSAFLRGVLTALETTDVGATVRLFVPDAIVTEVQRDRRLGARLAEQVERHGHDVRSTSIDATLPGLIRTTTRMYAVPCGPTDDVVAVRTEATDRLESVLDEYETLWATSDPVSPRTPARSAIVETAGEHLGPAFGRDVARFLDAEWPDDRDEAASLAEVLLLLGGKHELLLYDLAHWCEEIGLLSRATLSRRKNTLEEQGFLTTASVQVDVGRPRHRLLLARDAFETAEAGPAVEAGDADPVELARALGEARRDASSGTPD